MLLSSGLWALALAGLASAAPVSSPTLPSDAELAGIESALLEAVSEDPDDASAWYDMGVVRLMRKDIGGARAAFELTLEANPWHSEAMNALADTLFIQGEVAAGIAWLERAWQVDPTNTHALYNLGEVSVKAERAEAAIFFLEETLRVDPTHRKAALRLAQVYTATGQYEAAHAPLAALLADDPTDVEALLADGLAWHRAGDHERALDCWLTARLMAPERLDAQRYVAMACTSMGQWSCAEVALGDALALAPGRSDLWLQRGQVRARLGPELWPRAAADFSQAATLNPTDPRPLFERGVLLEQIDQPAEALASYLRAAERQPAHCPSQLNASRLLIQQGRYAEAELGLDSCLAARPGYAPAQLNRGWARADAGLCDLAAEDLGPLADAGGEAGERAEALLEGRCGDAR